MILVRFGDPIYLNLQLESGETGKYPQAILKDHTGTELAGSPVDLADHGDGLYQNSSVNMPGTPFVVATYKVYHDAAHTQPADTYDSINVYVLDQDEIPQFEEAIIGEYDDEDTFLGAVEDESDIVGEFEDVDDVEGYIYDDEYILGEIEDETDYLGEIGDCD
jgi:hypothetical protein